MPKAYFACDLPIEGILAAFNAAGLWQWGLRDGGDYLNCPSNEHVRLRVYEQIGRR